MKKYILVMLSILTLSSAASAQNGDFRGGGGIVYSIPVGSLGDRFLPALGGEFHFGKQTSGNWFWSGKFEYYKFSKGNEDKFLVKKEVEVNGSPVLIETGLKNLKLELEIIGLSANAHYNLIKGDLIEGDVKFGFGLFRWYYFRSSYDDTLQVDNGSGQTVPVPVNAPSISQSDWSGGFNLGIESRVKIFNPVWLYAAVDYNLIIAEIWPALALGLENISSFQSVNIRAGIKVGF